MPQLALPPASYSFKMWALPVGHNNMARFYGRLLCYLAPFGSGVSGPRTVSVFVNCDDISLMVYSQNTANPGDNKLEVISTLSELIGYSDKLFVELGNCCTNRYSAIMNSDADTIIPWLRKFKGSLDKKGDK